MTAPDTKLWHGSNTGTFCTTANLICVETPFKINKEAFFFNCLSIIVYTP